MFVPIRIDNFLRSLKSHIDSGIKQVSEGDRIKRMLICGQCEHFNNNWCAHCGCYVPLKSQWSTEKCPIGLWGSEIQVNRATPNEPAYRCDGCQQARSSGDTNTNPSISVTSDDVIIASDISV